MENVFSKFVLSIVIILVGVFLQDQVIIYVTKMVTMSEKNHNVYIMCSIPLIMLISFIAIAILIIYSIKKVWK